MVRAPSMVILVGAGDALFVVAGAPVANGAVPQRKRRPASDLEPFVGPVSGPGRWSWLEQQSLGSHLHGHVGGTWRWRRRRSGVPQVSKRGGIDGLMSPPRS